MHCFSFVVATISEFPLGKLYNLTLIAFCIFIPCFVISNLFYLRQNQDQTNQQGQPDGEEISFNVARYKKTMATVFWIEVTLIACYLPYVMVIAEILVICYPIGPTSRHATRSS